MQRNVGRETDPEKLLRSVLHRRGLRFRKDLRLEPPLKITADIVFTKQRVCVFIDGCFWHGCPLHFEVPKTNSDWWREKIEDNRARDIRQTRQLEDCGWTVLRYWEHDLTSENLPEVCNKIEKTVRGQQK
jgi:DNA mismatch endonuclease (patch repair protein)